MISKKKKRLKTYFNQFNLSGDMRRVKELLLRDPNLDFLSVEFKLSSDKNIRLCQLHILEKKDGKGRLNDQITLLLRNIFPQNKDIFSEVLKFAMDHDLRIGYSVNDGSPAAFKMLFFFDEGFAKIKKPLKKFFRRLKLSSKVVFFGDNCRFIGVESGDETPLISVYKHLGQGFFPGKEDFKIFSTVDIGEKNDYFLSQKFSFSGDFIYSKLYLKYHPGVEKLLKKENIGMFLGDKKFIRDIYENFHDFRVSALGMRCEDNKKDIYISPN